MDAAGLTNGGDQSNPLLQTRPHVFALYHSFSSVRGCMVLLWHASPDPLPAKKCLHYLCKVYMEMYKIRFAFVHGEKKFVLSV